MSIQQLNNLNLKAGLEANGDVGEDGQVLSSTGPNGVEWINQSAITASSDFIYYEVKNETGSTILKGKGVMAVGTDGNSGHILVDEMVADGTIAPRYFLGVLETDIENGGFARVIAFGELDQFNTNGQNGETWSNGQVIWCDPDSPGDFTITEPLGPNVKIPAAFILKASTQGRIQVRVQANEGVKDLYDTKIESGRVRRSTLTTPGSGYTVANNVPTTGGNGTGLEINILTLGVGDSIDTYSIASIKEGANYIAGDVVTVNAGNTDATITIDETWPLGGNTFVYNANDNVWINDATLTVDYINKRVGVGTTNPNIGFHCDLKAKFRNEVRIDQKNNNAILGEGSNYDNLVGSANTAVGTNIMGAAVSASQNTAVGYNALAAAQGGNNNAVFGYGAGSSILNGSFNVALGASALPAATNTQSNIAIGYNAQQSNISGNTNIAIGRNALGAMTANFSNTVIGTDAARLASNMNRAVVIGSEALGVGTAGNDVVLVGNQAGQNNTAGWTVAIGSRALQANGNGAFNTAVGGQALNAVTGGTGRYNVGLGYQAGNNVTTGQNNIVIGFQAQASSATASNEITLGNSSISVLRCAVTTITSLSDERDKTDITNLEYGLDFINSLSPKQFTWDQRPEYAIEIDDDGNETQVEVENANKGRKDFGFIAQDVQSVDNDILRLVYAENPEKLEMSYGKLVPILVQAIKDLTNRIQALEA